MFGDTVSSWRTNANSETYMTAPSRLTKSLTWDSVLESWRHKYATFGISGRIVFGCSYFEVIKPLHPACCSCAYFMSYWLVKNETPFASNPSFGLFMRWGLMALFSVSQDIHIWNFEGPLTKYVKVCSNDYNVSLIVQSLCIRRVILATWCFKSLWIWKQLILTTSMFVYLLLRRLEDNV